MTKLPPYLGPVNILESGANDKIKEHGRMSREASQPLYDLNCSIHGIVAFGIIRAHFEREEERHRNREGCAGIIRLKEKR